MCTEDTTALCLSRVQSVKCMLLSLISVLERRCESQMNVSPIFRYLLLKTRQLLVPRDSGQEEETEDCHIIPKHSTRISSASVKKSGNSVEPKFFQRMRALSLTRPDNADERHGIFQEIMHLCDDGNDNTRERTKYLQQVKRQAMIEFEKVTLVRSWTLRFRQPYWQKQGQKVQVKVNEV